MSELCRFQGIIIRIYSREHDPPHFHAVYGEHQVLVEIDTLETYSGYLPTRQQRLVMRWASLRRNELRVAWNRAQQRRPMGKIAPLD